MEEANGGSHSEMSCLCYLKPLEIALSRVASSVHEGIQSPSNEASVRYKTSDATYHGHKCIGDGVHLNVQKG